MQGLALDRQALHINHAPRLYYFSYFSDRVLCLFSQAGLDPDTPNYNIHTAGIIVTYHHIYLVC
jgi:hypothetical protein